jgi:hypothetical protein
MKIEINLNESIKVKLTDKGLNILNKIREEEKEKYNISDNDYPDLKIDDEGYYHTQLHCFMHDFGKYLFNGADNVIEPPINIIIEREVK